MNRRDSASFLWFLVGWTAGGLVTGLMGWPWLLAFLPAIALAILVRTAPAGWLWTRSGTGRRMTGPRRSLFDAPSRAPLPEPIPGGP